MAKPPTLHPYSDRASFDRLLTLIATLAHHPGAGSRTDKATQDQDSLESLRQHMKQMTEQLDLALSDCSVHTLRKDLMTLREYGILDRHRHDWGYYLGSGALNREELQLALDALRSQATYQGDAQARRIYQTLRQRLKPLNLESQGQLFYPVRAQWHRAIVHTDPEEMMRHRQNRDTLFHQLDQLETAIRQGLPIEVYQARTLYDTHPTHRQIYPLQLLYHDIAWYLVMEDCANGYLAVSRMDRFNNYLQPLEAIGRGIEAQQNSLAIAHQLLRNGWGLYLGEPDDQQRERENALPLITVKVRFFPPATHFIQEGERRHPKQKIVLGPKDEQTGEVTHLDYSVKLPPRSLNEFSYWVARHLGNAQVLAPPDLVEKHRQAAQQLVARYPS